MTVRGIIKRVDTKKKQRRKNIKDKLKDFKKLMLIICLLLNFVLGKKNLNAWNVFWSGSLKK